MALTAYGRADDRAAALAAGYAAHLAKPVLPSVLAEALRRVVEERAKARGERPGP